GFAPVYVQQVVPIVQTVPVAVVPAAAVGVPSTSHAAPTLPAPTPGTREEDVERYQHQLQSAEPRDRSEAVVQLGRLRAAVAQGALTAALTNDRSPLVREA